MEEKRTSVFENGLIWFGAAVSIAEILTGTYVAPLGLSKGLLAILIGHMIGCAMLFLAGLIGGKVRKSAMETTKMSFGSKGSPGTPGGAGKENYRGSSLRRITYSGGSERLPGLRAGRI